MVNALAAHEQATSKYFCLFIAYKTNFSIHSALNHYSCALAVLSAPHARDRLRPGLLPGPTSLSAAGTCGLISGQNCIQRCAAPLVVPTGGSKIVKSCHYGLYLSADWIGFTLASDASMREVVGKQLAKRLRHCMLLSPVCGFCFTCALYVHGCGNYKLQVAGTRLLL